MCSGRARTEHLRKAEGLDDNVEDEPLSSAHHEELFTKLRTSYNLLSIDIRRVLRRAQFGQREARVRGMGAPTPRGSEADVGCDSETAEEA